jgi:hypothetical protein
MRRQADFRSSDLHYFLSHVAAALIFLELLSSPTRCNLDLSVSTQTATVMDYILFTEVQRSWKDTGKVKLSLFLLTVRGGS